MSQLQFAILIAGLLANALGLFLLWRRGRGEDESARLTKAIDESSRRLAGEFQKANTDMAARVEQMKGDLRGDLSERLQKGSLEVRESVDKQLATTREEQARRLGETVLSLEKKFESLKSGTGEKLDAMSHKQSLALREVREELGASFTRLTESNEKKLGEMREAVEKKLTQIQADNATGLEAMRKTVDEKLQSTLEKRLGESFKLVSERLEQVHKGLGEMQLLANGVGDLRRVLTNVKARGTWGEMQLGNLLEQVLTAEQFERNVATVPGSSERVEFAIRLPGRDDVNGETVWLPIDSKFPKEDYERLVEAADRSDAAALEDAARQLELRVKAEAKTIREKYVAPPHTTDFAVLFLPTEGLYAEVLRRPGLVDHLQRECRVTVAGPTVLAALLNSLQMGFRTLAIEQRSSEVWKVLGAIKTEFGRFGDVLGKVQKKLQEASNVVDSASVRTRAIERKLRTVDQMPAPEAAALLGDPAEPNGDDEAESPKEDN